MLGWTPPATPQPQAPHTCLEGLPMEGSCSLRRKDGQAVKEWCGPEREGGEQRDSTSEQGRQAEPPWLGMGNWAWTLFPLLLPNTATHPSEMVRLVDFERQMTKSHSVILRLSPQTL